MSIASGSNHALSFRTATAEEATQLATLINTAFRSEPTGQTWLYDSQDKRIDIVSPDLISSLIANPNVAMLVGATGNNAVPIATTFVRRPSQPPEAHMTPGAAWLGYLAVSPEAHKQGYGLAMLREAERYVLHEWSVNRLEFDFVNARTELRAWYERSGYTSTGATRDFPYGEKGHLILASGLNMTVLGKDLK